MSMADPRSERKPLLLDLDTGDLKTSLLSLVVALVEVIKEALRLQAVKRMEGGSLTEAEVERLGEALMALEEALEQIKGELGITQPVKAVRDGLDHLVEDMVATVLAPRAERREEERL